MKAKRGVPIGRDFTLLVITIAISFLPNCNNVNAQVNTPVDILVTKIRTEWLSGSYIDKFNNTIYWDQIAITQFKLTIANFDEIDQILNQVNASVYKANPNGSLQFSRWAIPSTASSLPILLAPKTYCQFYFTGGVFWRVWLKIEEAWYNFTVSSHIHSGWPNDWPKVIHYRPEIQLLIDFIDNLPLIIVLIILIVIFFPRILKKRRLKQKDE